MSIYVFFHFGYEFFASYVYPIFKKDGHTLQYQLMNISWYYEATQQRRAWFCALPKNRAHLSKVGKMIWTGDRDRGYA
jgi:hypothetical protein